MSLCLNVFRKESSTWEGPQTLYLKLIQLKDRFDGPRSEGLFLFKKPFKDEYNYKLIIDY